MPDQEKEAKKISEGTETQTVYQVQFRSKDRAFMIKALGVIADSQWKDLYLKESHNGWGVPMSRYSAPNMEYGVPFQVAEAWRWILICHVETELVAPLFLETRIVERKKVTTHIVTEKGEVTKVPHWQEENDIWRHHQKLVEVVEQVKRT